MSRRYGMRVFDILQLFLLNCVSSYATTYTVTSIVPGSVSVFGGNTITITASDYPAFSGIVDIVCKWEDDFAVSGQFMTATTITCPVPSVFRFTPFVTTSTATLTSLKVSFDIETDAQNVVPITSIIFRSVEQELASFDIFPRWNFESFSDSVVTVTGSGFPTDLLPDQTFCRFSMLDDKGRYGSSIYGPGTVDSATILSCVAPKLDEIDPLASGPALSVIQLSFDGGQTFSFSQTGFYYLKDFNVITVSPSSLITDGGTVITLIGTNFHDAVALSCRLISIGETTVRHYDASEVTFVSDSKVQCVVPHFEPPIDPGTFDVYMTIDGINFVDTGKNVAFLVASLGGNITPSSGYYTGGSVVTIIGDGFVDSDETLCQFGSVGTFLASYVSSTMVTCRSPACSSAFAEYIGEPEQCYGTVHVAVVTGALLDLPTLSNSPLTFTYISLQRIHHFMPWPGSGWDAVFETTIYGVGLDIAGGNLYCKWGDLDPVLATSHGPLTESGDEEIDSWAICYAPVLPLSYRPDYSLTGLDFYLTHVELSMNDIDYTHDRRQWYYYEPATVTSLFPTSVWREAVSQGGIYITGTFFRSIATEFMSCLWYYDDTIYEVVPAYFADRRTIKCAPAVPVDADSTIVRVEVTMTPEVYSDSGLSLSAVQRPYIYSVEPLQGPYLGQTELVLRGQYLYHAEDLDQIVYIVIGDVPVEGVRGVLPGGDQTVTIKTPPVPHWEGTPALLSIEIAVNSQDRFAYSEVYTYTAVSAGQYFDHGTARPCPIGSFCGGGYPANDTDAYTSVLLPNPCPAGTFQPEPGRSGCFACASPGHCPGSGMGTPSLCPPGRVCWSDTVDSGFAADAPYCAMGKLCVPPIFILDEIPAVIDPFARRLTEGSQTVDCPEGQFCPPGSVSVSPYCSQRGVWCSGGAATPYTFDEDAVLGFYVDDEGTLLECPVGYSCVAGIRSACPAGTFQTVPGSSECTSCTAGTICPTAVREFPRMCPRGRVCSLPGRYAATYLCPAGSYCLFATITLSTTGVVHANNRPQICAAGSYCLPGTNAELPDASNPGAPRQCAVGFYCYTNETDYQGQGPCPLGHYCVLGSPIPIQAPKGYYVDYEGAYTPSRCPHGYYQDETGQSSCKLCVEGSECPTDGMEAPVLCAPAHYRSNSDPFYTQIADNIDCHPCPEGTWHWNGNLTASSQCLTCPERYVCARQGMTVFALKNETDCSSNSNGVSLCYALSQANDCPEGYACDAGTTSFTQYDFPCEPGYYCKLLTALSEMRNLLCPDGFYCKQATGATKASSLPCPAGFFCPLGTAEVDQGVNSRTLYNVQTEYTDPTTGLVTTDVNTTNSVTGASCRVCDPDLFIPPTLVDTSACTPCGELAAEFIGGTFTRRLSVPNNTHVSYEMIPLPSLRDMNPTHYVPIGAWTALGCPDGTTSGRGSGKPGDCIQEGKVLAVVNLYNSAQVVENLSTGTSTALWRPDYEFSWVDPSTPQYAAKTSLPYGRPVSVANPYVVDFLAYDPRETSAYSFVSIEMNAMDLMTVVLDFSRVPKDTVMATTANPGGHYNLVVASDKLASGSSSYVLPVTINLGDGEIHDSFVLKLLALTDAVNINITISLVHGNHYPDMHYFNDAATISLDYPHKADVGKRANFYAVISADLLNNGGYELPFNMIPTYANEPGDLSLVVDLGGQLNYTIDPSLKTGMIPGTTFWQVAPASTVVTPWFPFFSNCDYYDKHIVIWDLFENGDTLPSEAGECKFYPADEVLIVPPLVFDIATGVFQFQPQADYCEVAMHCRYEDNLVFGSADPMPWMSIPGSTTLFYLTQDPLLFADVSTLELDSWVGTDALIPVLYDASTRTGNFPRLIHLQIDYSQVTTTTKRIVQARMSLSNFDNNATRTDYVLQISWEPMNWAEMMNAFQLPMYVYVIVFSLCGLAAVGAALLAWGILQIATKSTRIPPFRIYDCYYFFMNYAAQGVIIGVIPPAVVAGLIKVIMLNSLDPLAEVSCAWTKGASSTAAVLIAGTEDILICQAVRTGTCLIMAGVFILWSASLYFSPRLPEDHKEFLVAGATPRVLQDDGIFYPAKTRYAKSIISSVLQWKRIHLFFVAVLLTMPLMTLFAFSYTDMFGSFTTSYTIGYMLTMLMADLLFVKVAREKLMFNALAVVTDVVYFVATLAAIDLNAFIGSFLLQQFFTVAQRLVAEKVIAYSYETIIPGAAKWIRSRRIVWGIVMGLTNLSRHIRHQPAKQSIGGATVVSAAPLMGSVDIPVLQYTEARRDKLDSTIPIIDNEEIENIDENADQTMGVAARTLSLIFSPFAILLLVLFPTETMFPSNYRLRYSAIPYYLVFSILIIPFQIGLDLVLNHGYDASLGTRIYDYMYLCQWRWKNRLTRWLLDDARLDTSIGQSTQALHHLCFSPQFYFIVTYAISGGLFVTYGITCWIVHGLPAFIDPAFVYYVVLMFLATRVADAIARWLVFYVMWKPADRAPERAFIQSIALGLKQKELEEHQVAFRNFFFKKHREWIIENLDKVYTPRGMEKYRAQLSDIYQRVLTTRIPYLYTAPPRATVPTAIEKPKDDTIADLAKIEYATNDDMYEVLLSSDEEEGVAIADDLAKSSRVGSALMQGWYLVAKQRLGTTQRPALRVETEQAELIETYPDWLVVNMAPGSRELLSQWLKQARDRIAGKRGNIW